jgi:hypothetical protein
MGLTSGTALILDPLSPEVGGQQEGTPLTTSLLRVKYSYVSQC